MTRVDAIHHYWFRDLAETHAYFAERNALWFGGTPEIDREIEEKFGGDLRAAVTGSPSAGGEISPSHLEWAKTPRGLVALVVLLDQFALNVYREKPDSYACSSLVLPVVKSAIARGWDADLTVAERKFLYLPFEHAENIPDQERSVALYEKLLADAKQSNNAAAIADAEGALEYAVRHHRVVARFGRFPDRNDVFGRMDTPEEKIFNASDEAPF